eukprot:scaffold83191_cov31-Tisochrysis_lutea.AAC.1
MSIHNEVVAHSLSTDGYVPCRELGICPRAASMLLRSGQMSMLLGSRRAWRRVGVSNAQGTFASKGPPHMARWLCSGTIL